jgi:adenosylcobinamide-phosphate guanylyltransferase
MNARTEKPLLQVGSKPMMQHVVDALKQSKKVDRIIVAVSASTPETARKAKELGLEVLETPGEGYVSDVKYAIRKLNLHDVLTVSADLPFITSETVDRAVKKYRESGKPSLAIVSPIEVYERLGSEPEYVFRVNGRCMVPVGINIIDGTRADESELEQALLVTESEGMALNVNTSRELRVARERLRRIGGTMRMTRGGGLFLPRKVSRTYRLARISAFSALCVVGSFIHPPSPIQSVAFDSSPGFFAALYFGALDGATVAGIGHLATSIISGFPLGVLHLPIALGMTVAGAVIGLVNQLHHRWGFVVAVILGVFINTSLVVLAVPVLGWAAALLFLPFLFMAASLNSVIAALVYVSIRGRLRSWEHSATGRE